MAARRAAFIVALIFLQEMSLLVNGYVCPWGWIHNGTSCYSHVAESKYWAEADANCQDLNALLVVIESAEEQAFITDLLNQQEDPYAEVWLGCNDIHNEGEWVCLDGKKSTKPMEFENWYGSSNHHCAISARYYDGKWDAISCTVRVAPSVCERTTCPQFCRSHPICKN